MEWRNLISEEKGIKAAVFGYCFLTFYYLGFYNWAYDCLGINISALGMLAQALLLFKIAVTGYTFQERLIIVFLFAAAAVTVLCSTDMTCLTNVIVICSMKNIDIEKIWKKLFVCGAVATGLVIISSLAGIMPPVSLTQDFGRSVGIETRYCLGFYHPNRLHWQIVQLMLLVSATYYERIRIREVTCMMAVNAVCYLLTASRTGMLCGTVLCVLLLAYRYGEKIISCTVWKITEITGAAAIVLFSIFSAILYNGEGFLQKVDRLLNSRISIASEYYHVMGVTLFGNPGYGNMTTENGYIQMLLGWGIIPLLFVIALEFAVLIWAIRKGKDKVRILILLTLIYGFMEYIGLLKAFRNLTFFYIGTVLFSMPAKYLESGKEGRRRLHCGNNKK